MSDFTLSDLRSVFGSVAIADVWYFYCPTRGALVIIVVNMILSFILFGKKDK